MSAARRVFISYSHDSEAHRARVLELAQRLRSEGIDAWLDRFVDNPPEGWPQWSEQQIANAAHVLVICTETYRQRFEGDEVGGIEFEPFVISSALAHASAARFIPVLLEGGASQHIPLALRPLTAYYLPEQMPQLLLRLGAAGKPAAQLLGTSSLVALAAKVDPDVYEAVRRPPPTRSIANFSLLGNPDFLGRAAMIGEIKATLRAPKLGGAWEPQVILGVAGVGKTQLALEYAYRQQDQYDVLWLARAVDASTLGLSFAELARELELIAPEVRDLQVRARATRSWLAEHDRWLLIFDDCPAAETIRPFLPPAPRGHVIVTSRNADWQGPGKRLVLGPLAREQSIELLMRSSGRTDGDGADALAAVLGDVPLALAVTGSLLEVTGENFTSARQQIETDTAAAGRPELPAGPVAASVNHAVATIKGKHAAAAPLFEIMAFVAPERIPLALFREHTTVLPAPLAEVARDGHALGALVDELGRLAAVSREGDAISLHPLFQSVMRVGTGSRSAATLLGVAFPDPEAPSTWPHAQELLPHALAVLANPALDHDSPADAFELLSRVAEYLRLRGELPQAIALQRRALALAEQFFAGDAVRLAATTTALGAMLRANGELVEAEVRLLRCLELGVDPTIELRDLRFVPLIREIAIISAEKGQLADARRFLQNALELEQTVRGGEDHLSIAETMSSLGEVAGQGGAVSEAVVLLEQALRMEERLLGAEPNFIVAVTLRRLALIREQVGSYAEARWLIERGLADVRACFRDGHHRLGLLLLNDLGRILKAEGDLAGARRVLEEAMGVSRVLYGTDTSVENVATLNNLAGALAATGDVAGARRYLDRAIDLLASSPGGRDRRLAGLIENRADLLRVAGSPLAAQADLEQAASIHEAAGSDLDPDFLRVSRKQASVMVDLGRLIDSRARLERNVARIAAALGPDHVEHALHRVELGRIAVAQERLDDARHHYQQAIEVGRKALGDEHPEVANMEAALAVLLARTGELNEAASRAAIARDIYIARLGPRSPLVGSIFITEGQIEYRRERWNEAVDKAAQAAAVLGQVGDAAGEASAHELAGHGLLRLGRPSEAANTFMRSLQFADSATARDALLDLVEHLAGGGEPFDTGPAVALLARAAPEWLAERVCDGATLVKSTLDRGLTTRIKVTRPHVAAAITRLEAGDRDELLGWRLELAAIMGESAAAEVRALDARARVDAGALELTADVAELPRGVYLSTLRFVVKGRDVWRADITVSNAEAANPFVAGPPVIDPQRFFGRRQFLTDVRQQLEAASVALLGPRRSGKTSVLYRLRELCKDDWLVAFADLHGFSGVDSKELVGGIGEEVAAAAGFTFDSDDARPLEALRRALRGAKVGKVLLLLDEISVLADHPDAAFQLRAMSKWTAPLMRIIFTGTTRDLDSVSTATFDQRGSSPLNELVNRELDQLTRQESLALLEQPVLGRYTYQPGALDRLVDLGAGRPFFLNLFAYLTVEVARQEDARMVTTAHVDAARAEAMSYLDRWFREFLHELDNDSYAALPDLLATNARLTGKHAEALRSAGITIGPRRDMRLDPIFVDWWTTGDRR